MFKNKGDELESLVQYVYQTLSDIQGSGITVEKKYKIQGKGAGKVIHEIDVFYQFEMNGITHSVIFECKNWNTKITKEKILALKALRDEIPNSVAVMVSKKGYQKGAEIYGKQEGIQLISGNKTSLISIVVSSKLQIMLPDERVEGNPFWTLMEYKNGKLTGNYFSQESSGNLSVTLFYSKIISEKFLSKLPDSNSWVVRGITQRHLKILTKLITSQEVDIYLYYLPFWIEDVNEKNPIFIQIPPHDLKKYYIYK
ncbi:restriction endonuclease [Lactococcus garvieae]|uniref:restriction endonuclease n=1 Tax=Lactococcus garvieae TaxID=1363 RepID=UPI00254C1A61|nr:restriction endonuclease [Lactococcus garvieae]